MCRIGHHFFRVLSGHHHSSHHYFTRGDAVCHENENLDFAKARISAFAAPHAAHYLTVLGTKCARLKSWHNSIY